MIAALRLHSVLIVSLIMLGGAWRTSAQLSIATPDTAICPGASVTLTANYTGRTPNLVNLPDDKYTGVVSIGFPFTFYGNTYTTCLISSNGYITFNTGAAGQFSEYAVPTASLPLSGTSTHLQNAIMACYADLYPNNAGDIDWALIGTAPNRRFIATWCNMPYYLPTSCPGTVVVVQAVLYEGTNVIEINTRQKDLCSSSQGGRAIQGLQNNAGTVAHIVPGRNAPTQWTAVNSSYQFVPSGSSYTVAPIPYSFISRAAWYTNNTTFLSTSNTITVSPATSTFYTYRTDCADNLSDTVKVTVLGPRLYVDSGVAVSGTGASWASPLKTVSQALGIANAANCVNEIWVKKGTYLPMAGAVVASSRDSSFRILRNGVKMYGSFAGGETALTQRSAAVIAANPTILSGDIGVANDTTDNIHHVVTVLAAPGQVLDTSTTLDGFTITRGMANGALSFTVAGTVVSQQHGGGVYIGAAGAGAANGVRIRRCTITGNRAGSGAGSYLNIAGSTVASAPLFDACSFTANRATTTGGAVCLPTTTATNTTATFRATSLTGNRADGDGGAMFTAAGAVVFEASTISADTSDATGGGVRAIAGKVSFANTTVSGCRGNNAGGLCADGTIVSAVGSRFIGNASNIFGGGIAQFGGTLSLRSSVFSGNSSVNGGGGVYSNAGAADSVVNCVFAGNTSALGGGLNHGPSAGALRVINSTFAGNTVSGTGGALVFETQTAGATSEISNTILWGNAAAASASIYKPAAATAALTVAFTDIQGGYTGPNNLALDPLFINPADPDGADNVWATLDDGLRLDTCSPAIGAGSNGLVPTSVATDITGAARIQLGTVDMGAYEHPYNFAGFPDVTINSGVPSPVCAGSPVTFTATAINTGIASYQWFINSSAATTTSSASFTTSALANGDTVWVILTNLDCGYSDTSNRVVVTVNSAPGAIGTITGPAAPCVGTTPTYSVPSVINATSYTWTLPSGWSGTSSGASITPTVGPNNGTVTVTASNGCGTVTSASLAVTPVPTPVLTGIISGPDTVCAGSLNTFSVGVSNGAATYTWTTPNGWAGTSNTPTLSTTASATGGTVSVVASNVCGTSATLQKAVAVIGIPAAPAAISGLVAPCVGTSQTYSVPSVPDATSYTWTLPGGWTGSSTTASIPVTVGAASGNVTVTAGNMCGGSTTSVLTVTPVNGIGTPGPIIGPQTVCSGAQLTYSVATVPGASSYTWSLPGGWAGSSTTSSITVVTTSTSGTISVTATNSCGQTSNASTLTVTSGGAAAQPGPITGAALVCAGTQQTYSITPVPGALSYTWTLPNGWTGSSNAASITATPNATGGTITVVANASCGASSQQTLVVTSAATPAAPSSITGATAVCAGVAQTYSVTPVAGATSYTWTLPAGWNGNSTSTSISATPTATGGIITLTASNYCGTSTSSALAVSANAVPTTPGSISGATQICVGTQQTYSVAPVAGATSYTWTLPTGWSGSTTGTSIVTTPTTTGGTLSVTATNYCGTSTASTLVVTTGAAPAQPGTITGPDTVCAGAAQTFSVTPVPGATSYTWTLPTGWSGGGTGASISAIPGAAGGTVTVVAVNACGTSAAQTKAVTSLAVPTQPSGITGPVSVCSGTSQTYSVNAVPGVTSYTWSLPNGWTGSSNTPSISVVPSATSGTVAVSATSFCGASSTSTLTVNVTSTPASPGVVSGNSTPCVGSSQTYSVAGVPGAASYTWTLPSGWLGSSSTASLTTTVGTGSGTVSVTASNICGTSAAASLAVTSVSIPLQPSAITGATAPCSGTSQTYSVTAAPGAQYAWTLPTGWSGASSTASISTTPTPAGGTISVTASNACGTSPARTLTVTPQTTPAQPGVISLPTSQCQGSSGTYSVAPVAGATSYTWTFPAGWSGGGTTPSVTAVSGASGTISVTANNGCGASTPSSTAVTISPLPTMSGAISGTAQLCIGSQAVYTAPTATNAVSYVWTLPSGLTGSSSTSSIAVSASAAGTGNVQVVAVNNCGNSTPVSLPVTVNPTTATAVFVTSTYPNGGVCPGVPATFTAVATGGGTSPSFTWTRNGSVQTAVTGSTFTISNPQSGEVIGVSMSSTATCPSPATAVSTPLTITVLPAIVPGININTQYSNVPTICPATQLNFTANIVGGGTAPMYQWRKNGVIVGTNAPTYSATGWNNGDTVWAILTSNAQCAIPAVQPSNKIGVTVGAPVTPTVNIAVSPSATYVPGQTYTFTATPTNAGVTPMYQWMRNSQNILGAYNATYTTNALTGNDTISVRLTSNDVCAATPVVFSNKIVMTSSTAVYSVKTGMGIGLYPNPNGGTFTLSMQGSRSGVPLNIEVLNALGQAVWQREVVTDRVDWRLPVELPAVANGVYLLRLREEDGGLSTQRFEVRR